MQLEDGIQKRNELEVCLLENFLMLEENVKIIVLRELVQMENFNIKGTLGHLQNFAHVYAHTYTQFV